jgi:hypothetical protein
MRRLIARSRLLLPAPDGPTTAVISPSGTRAWTPASICAPPTAYPSLRTSILGRSKLERYPSEVGVEALVEDVGVFHEGVVVGQRELHPTHDGVQALGLGPPVLLVH